MVKVHSTTVMPTLTASSLLEVSGRPGGVIVCHPSPRTQTGAHFIVDIVDNRFDVTSGAARDLQDSSKVGDLDFLNKVVMSTDMFELLIGRKTFIWRTFSAFS